MTMMMRFRSGRGGRGPSRRWAAWGGALLLALAPACDDSHPSKGEGEPAQQAKPCPPCAAEEFCYSGQCRAAGEALVKGTLGAQADQFGALDQVEAESEGPAALAAAPGGGAVYLLDQLNQRVTVFEDGRAHHSLPIEGTTSEEIALLPEERVVVRDRYADEFRVHDREGKVVSRNPVSGTGLESTAFAGPLYTRDDGIWMQADTKFIHVLDVRGNATQPRRVVPGLPSPDLKTLLSVELRKDRTLQLVSRPTTGEATYRHRQLRFDEPAAFVFGQDIDGEGRIYIGTGHLVPSPAGPDKLNYQLLLTVLSPKLDVLRQVELPVNDTGRSFSRALALSRSGSVFYLDVADDHISVRGY